MITDAIATFLAAVVVGLFGWLPETGSTDAVSTVTIAVAVWVRAANAWFPVVTAAVAVSVTLAAELALKIWDLAVWIYHQVWGSS